MCSTGWSETKGSVKAGPTQLGNFDLESLGTGATGWTGEPAECRGPNGVVELDL